MFQILNRSSMFVTAVFIVFSSFYFGKNLLAADFARIEVSRGNKSLNQKENREDIVYNIVSSLELEFKGLLKTSESKKEERERKADEDLKALFEGSMGTSLLYIDPALLSQSDDQTALSSSLSFMGSSLGSSYTDILSGAFRPWKVSPLDEDNEVNRNLLREEDEREKGYLYKIIKAIKEKTEPSLPVEEEQDVDDDSWCQSDEGENWDSSDGEEEASEEELEYTNNELKELPEEMVIKIVEKLVERDSFESFETEMEKEQRVLLKIKENEKISEEYSDFILKSGEHKNYQYILMKKMNEGSLQSYLQNSPVLVTEEEKIGILEDILCIIHAFHEENIFHRDLGLKNFLIDKDKVTGELQVRLADFGSTCLECENKGHTLDKEFYGNYAKTPDTDAPEIRLDRGSIKAEEKRKVFCRNIDYFQLGIIISEIFCGENPFAITPEMAREAGSPHIERLDRKKLTSSFLEKTYDKAMSKEVLNKIPEKYKELYKILISVDPNQRKKAKDILSELVSLPQ